MPSCVNYQRSGEPLYCNDKMLGHAPRMHGEPTGYQPQPSHQSSNTFSILFLATRNPTEIVIHAYHCSSPPKRRIALILTLG